MSAGKTTSSPTGAALAAVASLSPVGAIALAVTAAIKESKVTTATQEKLDEVRAETERQENEMRRLEAQAKVAQEMAIAARIESALEVQIEEFYEYAGEGKAGLNTDGKSLSIGASGSMKRISKRVYKFTGHGSSQPQDAAPE